MQVPFLLRISLGYSPVLPRPDMRTKTAYEPTQRQSTDSTGNATMNSANTSLLGSIGTAAGALNPFKFAHRIKDIWERQKAEYIAHERRKRMLADRRKRSEKAYEEMKRLGAAQGLTGNAAAVAGANQIRFKYEDYVMAGTDGDREDIGMALSTDSGDEASVGGDAAGASGEGGIKSDQFYEEQSGYFRRAAQQRQ